MGSSSNNNTQVKRLLHEREQTLLDLARLQEALRSEVDPDVDEADPDLVEREKVMVLVQSMERKLQSIDYALRQAEAGGYGICERCGQPIDPERLEILPETTFCVQCQMIVEKQALVRSAAPQF